jgi:beta-glucosidase
VVAVNGYVTGEFPPAVHNPEQAVRVLRNLLRAHTAAYCACKELDPSPSIGIATNMFVYAPARSWHPLDWLAARQADRGMNRALLEYLVTGVLDLWFPGVARERSNSGVRNACDMVGVNYYTRFHLQLTPGSRVPVRQVHRAPPERVTDMGWEIYPDGMQKVLSLAGRTTGLPVYVTENGIADDSDSKRAPFIRDHLASMENAMRAGVDVRGYFIWTLMDNFEWAHGFSKRFGLYEVDFGTQERTLRKGSEALAAHIRAVAGQA